MTQVHDLIAIFDKFSTPTGEESFEDACFNILSVLVNGLRCSDTGKTDSTLPPSTVEQLKSILQSHWRHIAGTRNSYEQAPEVFPNTVFIPVTQWLVNCGAIDERYTDTTLQNHFYIIFDEKDAIGPTSAFNFNVRDIFDIPKDNLFKTADNYYFDVEDLVDAIDEYGIRNIATGDTICAPCDFGVFYIKFTKAALPSIIFTIFTIWNV